MLILERYCYAKHAVNRVGINYEKARSMQQKAFYSGDYELVKTVAELAWLGLEPFEPAGENGREGGERKGGERTGGENGMMLRIIGKAVEGRRGRCNRRGLFLEKARLTDIFLESNIKVALLALAIVPKKNYLTSLPYVWGLVYEQYAGNDCNLPRNYANSMFVLPLPLSLLSLRLSSPRLSLSLLPSRFPCGLVYLPWLSS